MSIKHDANSVSLDRLVQHLDQLLETSSTPDYPNALNGLQLSNAGTVRKVAAAVDFSTRTANAAIEAKADFLIVHHGMFWKGLQALTGNMYSRLRGLIEADVAVYSSHLPLDRHPRLGNNALLARTLGLDPLEGFASFDGVFIGTQGRAGVKTSALVDRARSFSRACGGDVITSNTEDTERITHRWAVCSGAGASAETLTEATQHGIDTLIVGEGPHWTAIDAAERDISIIYMGHYASETLGVFALADEITEEFHVPSVKISAPTGL